MGRMMGRRWRAWLLAGAWALAGLAMGPGPASAAVSAPPVSVINNVLAESIVQTPKGITINRAIVGFRRGTADFQSLTQFVMAEPGTYTIRLDIYGPEGKLRATYGPFRVEANAPGWTHSQLTRWRDVRFEPDGLYHLVVQVEGKPIANFPIVVTD